MKAKALIALLLLAALLVPLVSCGGSAVVPGWNETTDKMTDFVKLRRGINLSGAEGSDGMPGYLLKDETYFGIAGKGFDHVRLPVDFRNYYKNSEHHTDGELDEGFMKKLDTAIALAVQNDLSVILDFHGWYDLDSSDEAQKALFQNIWKLIARRYRDASERLLFELLNEPHDNEGGNLNSLMLNRLQNETIALIRETNPTRLIVASPAEWNGPWKLAELDLPEDDENIIVAVHSYAPMTFTHQGATWANAEWTEQVRLNQAMLREFDSQMDDVKKYIEKTGRTVILDEFGVYQKVADPGDVTEYLAHAVAKCEELGIGWTYWEYNSGFGAFKPSLFGGGWRDCVMDGLIGK